MLPFLLLGAAIAGAIIGVEKGVEARDNLKLAEDIGRSAESKYKEEKNRLEKARQQTQSKLEDLGRLKIEVFKNQIGFLVEFIKKGRAQLKDFKAELITKDEIQAYEHNLNALEVVESLGSAVTRGIQAGTLVGFGAYSAVSMLGTASTGTAISTLSGAAATNATLAWFGGGALSAGGFGVAGGMLVLGGIALGPALAIGGFALASKAEEALTKAKAYAAEIGIAIAEMAKVRNVILPGINSNVDEVRRTILELVERFERVKAVAVSNYNEESVARLIMLGRALNEVLNMPILDSNGVAAQGLQLRLSGLMERLGPEAVK